MRFVMWCGKENLSIDITKKIILNYKLIFNEKKAFFVGLKIVKWQMCTPSCQGLSDGTKQATRDPHGLGGFRCDHKTNTYLYV